MHGPATVLPKVQSAQPRSRLPQALLAGHRRPRRDHHLLILAGLYFNGFKPPEVNKAAEAATVARIQPAGAVYAGCTGAAAQAAAAEAALAAAKAGRL